MVAIERHRREHCDHRLKLWATGGFETDEGCAWFRVALAPRPPCVTCSLTVEDERKPGWSRQAAQGSTVLGDTDNGRETQMEPD